jgi:sulfite oxidase
MSPGDKQVIIHDGSIHLEGWAYSGNGNWPERVEVSPDGCDASSMWRSLTALTRAQRARLVRVRPARPHDEALPRVAALEDRRACAPALRRRPLSAAQVPVDAEGWLEFCVRTWDCTSRALTAPTEADARPSVEQHRADVRSLRVEVRRLAFHALAAC